MRKSYMLMVLAILLSMTVIAYAGSRNSSEFLKQGLLGAGAGAVGGAASGAKGGDVWKGALAGAGVNIVGGMLLDSMSGEKVASEESVQRLDSKDAYSQGYQDGFQNGYKQGYTEGYKEGIKENLQAN